MSRIKFQTGEFYHVYNRGVDKRTVFSVESDYLRFLRSMKEFNTIEPVGSLESLCRGWTAPIGAVQPLQEPLVEIIVYALIPNHFHFILKQVADGGISEFMKRLSGGYTYFFNKKNDRSGVLFQGRFKAIHIDNNDYLLQLSCYINGNIEVHGISKVENYLWTSYLDYMGERNDPLCRTDEVLGQFENAQEYKKLLKSLIKDSAERKKEIEKFVDFE